MASERQTPVADYVGKLRASQRLGAAVVHHQVRPARPADVVPADETALGPAGREMLTPMAAAGLYRHQAEAIRAVAQHAHVVVATPTASGKSLVYHLPVMERFRSDPGSKALYLFPLKALAQDQLRAFNQLAGHLGEPAPQAAIYDGDTTAWHRRRIRTQPPAVLMTNPEMLHLSLLAHHAKWGAFYQGLQTVVIDEVHTYRGVFGSHMAQVLRRLQRVCAFYGNQPTFIFTSATVANPSELASQLIGQPVTAVTRNGAPCGRQHLVMLNPTGGAAQTAIVLLQAALPRGLRTIVYAQSRKYTELIAMWAQNRAGAFKDRISAYRAGFLPEQRREIEARLAGGDLLAVVTTSALELGIDIGSLDLCILVGYPGTIMSTLQRGGRVGRGGQESAMVLIAGDDALDQYFMRHPAELTTRPPEPAIVNPFNRYLLDRHLQCAAHELVLRPGREPYLSEPEMIRAAEDLVAGGRLLREADQNRLHVNRQGMHRRISLRGAGHRYTIKLAASGDAIGEIDDLRVRRDCHPGAIYLHDSCTYRVDALDLQRHTVTVTPARADYYTRVRFESDTEIVAVTEEKTIWGMWAGRGNLRVTETITGYEKVRIYDRNKLGVMPLDFEPTEFETEGIWFQIPAPDYVSIDPYRFDYLGALHAIEHAAIGMFPMLALADQSDLGGLSTPWHPQVKSAAIFIYDGLPGGAGLAHQGFHRAAELLRQTLQVIVECLCETGCPACVQSPQCGSGNRPIDKGAARTLLARLAKQTVPPGRMSLRIASAGQPPAKQPLTLFRSDASYAVMDLETQRSFEDVGGRRNIDQMGMSCAVVYDSRKDMFVTFLEDRVDALIDYLASFALVVGFNIKRFDYRVLSGYRRCNFKKINTLDIFQDVQQYLGYRVSLNRLAGETLGAAKSADGLTALRWWQEGRIDDIVTYCREDVRITRNLYRFGKEHGYLRFVHKQGFAARIPVAW